jgi:hypothetical protein
MCTTTAGVGKPVLVGDVAVYALPYLEPAVAGDDLGAAERTHAGTLRAAMARVRADAAGRGHAVVVSAHAFVAGGLSSESERDISVGGVSAVPPEVFAGADLVALGHLHGAQTLAETVRYSGSPVAMSFGEVGQVKGSYLWDIESGPSGARVRGEFVTAPVERPLRVLRGELADLLGDPALLGAEAAYCQVVLTDPVRPEIDAVRFGCTSGPSQQMLLRRGRVTIAAMPYHSSTSQVGRGSREPACSPGSGVATMSVGDRTPCECERVPDFVRDFTDRAADFLD